MSEFSLNTIPEEILKAYYPGGIASYSLIEGGEINTTMLVIGNGGNKTILQRLSKIYDSSLDEDYEAVSAYLKNLGWEMATALKSSNGARYTTDSSGRVWRAFGYIESEPGSKFEGDYKPTLALGELLGKLHHSLSTLSYNPKHPLGRGRDIAYHASHLEKVALKIKDSAKRKLAKDMISASKKQKVDTMPAQLIHSDPRIGNVLFRNGEAITFIDWDGYGISNPLFDVGDMLQSYVSERMFKKRKNVSASQLHSIIEAYYKEAKLKIDKNDFTKKALSASQLIGLCLGIRHLVDSVEDSYFTPPNSFEFRYDFNIRRAHEQWEVYKILKEN